MGIFGLVAASPIFVMLMAGDLDRDTRDHFDKIAESVSMAPTCRQHDFVVDDAGISDWKIRAVAMAVAGGMAEPDAQALLDQTIDEEYEDTKAMFEEARRTVRTRDQSERFNRRMKKACERLADHELSGDYFTED
ncbi:hypothetical protein NAP1_04250 [Erythrobacter sp. NAP1]|uniref:hypothetical protein n=1 Tax=Erythrobacter sp. NAP1 TaxID=237727 RepID=UPI0000686C9E|nr:hypothetical protein [Erythrobacter sp. NAP1]EAQ29956.1 hypothetical protein NAP1_04250 [Erythrobacter sp. NAP1]